MKEINKWVLIKLCFVGFVGCLLIVNSVNNLLEGVMKRFLIYWLTSLGHFHENTTITDVNTISTIPK